MISAAIQAKLAAIIPRTYLAIGDEDIEAPFCTHTETERELLLKEGNDGYEYDCAIAIIDDSPDDVETLKQSVITAIEALAGTTTNSTKIDSVAYQGDDPGFDEESKLYITILSFLIETSNR